MQDAHPTKNTKKYKETENQTTEGAEDTEQANLDEYQSNFDDYWLTRKGSGWYWLLRHQ